MPLPFILGGIAVAAGIAGVKKAHDASEKNKQAERINRKAEITCNNAKRLINDAREETHEALQTLGQKKLNIMSRDIHHFVESFSRIHHVDLTDSQGIRELEHLNLSKETLTEMKEQSSLAVDMASGIAGGAVAGGLTALGAYGAVMTFGAASTGTAIAALSGAAATNATLAFLGGGSLAAGGLGIAGGTAVLGGLVAGPALAILGFTLDSKADKNLENARSNQSKARKFEEEMNAAADLCDAITKRSVMFTQLLTRLSGLFRPMLREMDCIIDISGTDFRNYSKADKKTIAMSASLALAIKKVLDTPILHKDGSLTDTSYTVQQETADFLNEMEEQ